MPPLGVPKVATMACFLFSCGDVVERVVHTAWNSALNDTEGICQERRATFLVTVWLRCCCIVDQAMRIARQRAQEKKAIIVHPSFPYRSPARAHLPAAGTARWNELPLHVLPLIAHKFTDVRDLCTFERLCRATR